MISINDTEFILVPPNYKFEPDKQPWGIYKYTGIQNDKWQKFIQYPDDYRPDVDMKLCVDKANQLLFILALRMDDGWAKLPCILTIVDMNAHTFTHKSYPHTGKGWLAAMHIIGGFHSNEHLVYDVKQQQFTKLHEFSNFIYGTAVYLASRRSILLIGGEANEKTVRIYSVETNKWIKSSLVLDNEMYGVTTLLLKDEKYLIMNVGNTHPEPGLEVKYLF